MQEDWCEDSCFCDLTVESLYKTYNVPSCIHGVKCGPQSAVLLPMKSDFPNHDGVGAGMVRDGLRVVARDHTSHGLGGPRMNAQGVDVIPVRI